MSQHRAILLFVLAVLTGALDTVPAYAANSCDAIYQAGIKSVQTPHHVYSTTTPHGGKPQTGEAIYAGGVEYMQLQGKWRRSRITNQDMLESAQDKLKTQPDTCTLVGDRSINSQAVTVYKARNKEFGTTQEIRILKASGLLQSGTLTLPDGTAIESRYEYTNVHAPAGMQ